MSIYETILRRRSIRRYTQQPIEPEKIELLLKAAMAAPTARNQQPWEFIIVDDTIRREKLSRSHSAAGFLKEAPLGIVVCGNLQRCADDITQEYWIQDCSAAITIMQIAAVELELGSCWIGTHPRTERIALIKKVLALPEIIQPLGILSIGYPDEIKKPRTQFTKTYVHHNSW